MSKVPGPFTFVPKHAFRNPNLSDAAVRVLGTIMSHAERRKGEDWDN